MAGAPPSSEVVMRGYPVSLKPAAFLFAAALFAVASPLAAQQAVQQAAVPAPVVETVAAPVSAPTTPLPGPRVRAELRPVEPSFRSASAAPLPRYENTTISVSTIVLVLAVVILVLLVAR